MRIIRVLGASPIGLALAVLILGSAQSKADISATLTMFDSPTPTVSIQHTKADSTLTTVRVYAGAQKATALGSTPVYCIDLIHDNYVPVTYNVTPGTPNLAAGILNQIAWVVKYADTNYAGVGDVNGRSASQLVIWDILDPNFQVTNWESNSGLQSAFNTLGGIMAGPGGYDQNQNYTSGVQFYLATNHGANGNLYQDLVIGVVPVVPEPSTMAIAGLGALGTVGYGLRRRNARVV